MEQVKELRATFNGKTENIFTEFQQKPKVKWSPEDLNLSLYKLYQQYCTIMRSAQEKKWELDLFLFIVSTETIKEVTALPSIQPT